MPCVTCGAPGHDTHGTVLCIRHGGVPSAAFVAALVGGTDTPRWPDRVPLDAGIEPLTARWPAAGDEDGDEEIEDRPPAGLRAYTWLFGALTALHAVLLVVDVWALSREDTVLRGFATDPGSIERPAAASVFAFVDRVDSAVTVALWVTLLTFAVWFGLAGRVADRLGRDRRAVLRHWTYLGWRLALVPLVGYLIAEAARDDRRPADRAAFVAEALAVNHTAAMFASLRIVMLALLGAFVAVVWRRLNGVGEPDY